MKGYLILIKANGKWVLVLGDINGNGVSGNISNEADLYSLYKKAVDENEAKNLALKNFPDSHIIESKIGRQGVDVGYLTKANGHYSEDVIFGYNDWMAAYSELWEVKNGINKYFVKGAWYTSKETFNLYLQTLLPETMDCEYTVTENKVTITKINL